MKRALSILFATLLLIPLIGVTWLVMTESGLHWAARQVEPYLPGQLRMQKLEGNLMGAIKVSGLQYEQDGMRTEADELILEWLPITLFAAKVDISRLQVRELSIILPQTERTTQPLTLPDISLPWRVSVNDVVIDGFTLTQNEQTTSLKQIQLSASSLFSQLDIDALSIRADAFSLNIQGGLQLAQGYPHDLKMHWQTKLPSNTLINGKGQLRGNLAKTHIKQQLTGPLQISLDAELTDLLDQLNWQGKAKLTAFEAEKLGPGWPAITGRLTVEGKGDLATAALSGNLDGQYPELGPFDAKFKLRRQSDNSIEIDHLFLHAPNSDTRLHARGQWWPGTDGGKVALALDWQNLRWPLKDSTWFDSAIGSGWVEGNIHQYRAGLATDRPWPQAPPSFWYASADGNLEGLNFHSLRITALNGEALAKGQLHWSPQLTWQAQAKATNIDPAAYLPLGAQWPGQLKATLSSRGRSENGQLIVDADISQLTGTLRGYPVSLESRLSWRDAGFDIHSLDFHSGLNQLNAKGRIGETLKLDWSLTANELAELYPQAKGKLHAKGLLTGSRLAPTVQASVNGQALSFPDYAIGKLDGSLNVDVFQWQKLEINLTAETLALKGITLQSLNIASTEQHIAVNAVNKDLTARLELKGEADNQGWQGRIERADISSQQFKQWHLKKLAKLHIGATSLEVEPLCWLSNSSEICFTLQRNYNDWQAMLDGKQIPLMLLSPWLPADMTLEGVANAKADIQFLSSQLSGEADIQLPSGVVSFPLLEGERERWEYRRGLMTMSITDKGINANSNITMMNGDQIVFTAELPGAQALPIRSQQPLHAEARLTMHDIGLIESFIPEVYNVKGEVALKFVADGTLGQPKFSGQANLLNGSFHIPRLGLNIKQINVKAQTNHFDRLFFQLDARSGEGNLAVQGQTLLDSSAGWPTEISVKGNEFEVSHIPEARVLVSPDLQIKLEKNRIEINGETHIPFAKLQPKDLTTAARVSEDVIIVGDEKMANKKWSIFTRVRLILGERVNFYGFGFDGRIGGSLLLEDEPGQLTKATGELNIPEGRYRAYGQRLDIEQGRLLYTGGPLTNPGLNLRSVRRVQNVTVGLNVRGSLNQPQIELFSIPAMGQTDALSYLMLGRPIENATSEEGAMMAKATLALGISGGNRLARSLSEQFGLDDMRLESSEGNEQASLVMGRYLSPKLYVSYGVGLIESFNTIAVRYQISNRWQLKGESGEHQGADIFYTIER